MSTRQRYLPTFMMLILILLSISGCSGRETGSQPPEQTPPSLPDDQPPSTQTPPALPDDERPSEEPNWTFHQENEIDEQGFPYCKEAYVKEENSGYLFSVPGHPKGVGTFSDDVFVYNVLGVEYHYSLTIPGPIGKADIFFDIDDDGEKESLQDDGNEIVMKTKNGQEFVIHQISDLSKETGLFYYVPVLIKGLDGFAVLVVDPGANGFSAIHVYQYTARSQSFAPLTFTYQDGELAGKKDQVFYGHMRLTEDGYLEGTSRLPDSESVWVVKFYEITYEDTDLNVEEKYERPGGYRTTDNLLSKTVKR